MTVTSLSTQADIFTSNIVFLFSYQYGKDFVSCQNLYPKHLLMYLIYQQ